MAIFKNAEKLDNEELKDANGGYIYHAETSYAPGYGFSSFEVIDDETGDVVESFGYQDDAKEYAKANGYSTVNLTWPQLDSLRKNGHI